MSHLDLFWDDMEFRAFFEAIGTRFRVVRFDMRGTGLSDRDVTDRLSLDELTLDLDAVFDHLGLDEAVMYATCYGGPITVEWAARNPSRVSKLMLDGTYASGPQLGTPDMRESVRTAARLLGARTTAAAGHAMLAYFTRPDGMDTRDARFRRTRQSINADVAEILYNLSFEWDVTAACESITVPTLVTHRRESHAVPVRLGRELASLLPNAELVTFPGADHNPWEGDALEPLRAMARFLGAPIDTAYRRRARLRPTIVLFTDMEGSTSNAARLGDATAQELMRANKRIVETGLDDHGGKRVKSTGDGLMAEFGSVSQALMAAAAIQAAVAAHNAEQPDASFRLRMGVNAGEPLAEDDDLHGIVVHTAARICEHAHGGEVLVSNVVRELATGKDFRFADAGVFDIKGLDEPIRLFRLVT